MRTIESRKDKIVVELTADDIKRISALFSIIVADDGNQTTWWGSEDGRGGTILDEERFYALWDEWLDLTDGPEATAYFEGKA